MKKHILLISCLLLTGCGSKSSHTDSIDSSLYGIYSLDLNTVGMPLTVYLNLKDDSTFLFSNTTLFETIKSKGTLNPGKDKYVMVYNQVNGEDKSVSDGLVSEFVYDGKDTLTFTSDFIYYGSTSHVLTKNESDPSKILEAVRVTNDSVGKEEAKSEFEPGYYTATTSLDGLTFTHKATFFPDGTYLNFVSFISAENTFYYTETGNYYLTGNLLGIESKYPVNLQERLSGNVIDKTSFSLPVVSSKDGNKDKRKEAVFEKAEADKTVLFELKGQKGESLADLKILGDLSYTATVGDTKEDGYLSFRNLKVQEKEPGFKLYPNKKELSGLSYTNVIPEGKVTEEDGRISFRNVSLRSGNRRLSFDILTEEK